MLGSRLVRVITSLYSAKEVEINDDDPSRFADKRRPAISTSAFTRSIGPNRLYLTVVIAFVLTFFFFFGFA